MRSVILGGLVACLALTAAPAQEPQEFESVETADIDLVDLDEMPIPDVISLEFAQRYAISDNPSLLAAEARVEQARMRVRQARAEWFPQLGANVTASVLELSDRDRDAAIRGVRAGALGQLPQIFFSQGTPLFVQGLQLVGIANSYINADVDDTIETFQASLTANWLVFDGFGRKFRVAAARFGYEESEAAYREAQRLLLNAVAIAYHNVQLARENIAIAHADEEFNARQLEEAEARQRVGTGSLSDVLNFQVRIRAAKTSLYRAEQAYNVALIALAELMGVPEADLPTGAGVAPLDSEQPREMVMPEAEPLLAYARESRPDLDQAAAGVGRANAVVGVGRSTYFPRVNAFASKDAMRDDNASFDSNDFSSTLGVSVSYDIFTGGRRKAVLREAKAAREEAERLQDSAELVVASEVRQAIEDLITAQKELILQRETTGYVEQNRDLVEKEYNAGQGSLVRLNEAQRDLISQQSNLALALVALRQTWHNLRTATAETLEDVPPLD